MQADTAWPLAQIVKMQLYYFHTPYLFASSKFQPRTYTVAFHSVSIQLSFQMNYCNSTSLWQQQQLCAKEIVHLLHPETGLPTGEKELEQQTGKQKKKPSTSFMYLFQQSKFSYKIHIHLQKWFNYLCLLL